MSDRKEYFKKYREEHREIINKKARETYYKNKEEHPEYEKQRRREWSNNKRKKDKENAELVIKQKEVLDKIRNYLEKQVQIYGGGGLAQEQLENFNDLLEEIE